MAAGAHSVRTEILFKAPAATQENNIHLPPIPFKYTCGHCGQMAACTTFISAVL